MNGMMDDGWVCWARLEQGVHGLDQEAEDMTLVNVPEFCVGWMISSLDCEVSHASVSLRFVYVFIPHHFGLRPAPLCCVTRSFNDKVSQPITKTSS